MLIAELHDDRWLIKCRYDRKWYANWNSTGAISNRLLEVIFINSWSCIYETVMLSTTELCVNLFVSWISNQVVVLLSSERWFLSVELYVDAFLFFNQWMSFFFHLSSWAVYFVQALDGDVLSYHISTNYPITPKGRRTSIKNRQAHASPHLDYSHFINAASEKTWSWHPSKHGRPGSEQPNDIGWNINRPPS